MWKKGFKFSRCIAGSLAIMMILGAGTDKALAADYVPGSAEISLVKEYEGDTEEISEEENSEENSEEELSEKGAAASEEVTEEQNMEESKEIIESISGKEMATEGMSGEEAGEKTGDVSGEETGDVTVNINIPKAPTGEFVEDFTKVSTGVTDTTLEDVIARFGIATVGDAEAEDLAPMTPVKISASTFPDPNFRAYVSEAFDRDKDGYLDAEDILYARNIWADNMDIYSLEGIEYLTELRGLYASHNHLTELDLSGNQLITGVWVAYNDFTSLDFSSTPSLQWVYCFYCDNLRSLNVRGNPEMSYIEVNSSPIGSIDVSQNPKLEHLMCGDCGLTQLDLSHNPNMQHLDAFRNRFTKLDVTCCPKMKRLDVWDNPKLGSIDVSKCPGLQYYNCANNNAGSVDVTHNPELTKLICSYNQNPNTGFPGLTKLDVTKNPKLVYLDIGRNSITNLDISRNTELYFLYAFTNPIKELKIGNCRRLIKVYKDGVRKDEPNVCKGQSWTLSYGGDTSTGGDNIFCLLLDYTTKVNTDPIKGAPSPNNLIKPVVNPENLITRGAVIQKLYEMAGKPSVSGLKTRFSDVKPGSTYYNAVVWGEKYAMCMGVPDVYDNVFAADKYITRQDVAFMLMRYAECMGFRREIDFGRSDDYQDYYDIDYYAWEAVCWACTWRIMRGKGDQSDEEYENKGDRVIDPRGYSTRDEFETMVARMLEVNDVSPKKYPEFYKSGVSYATHVQTYGWQGLVRDGKLSGTVGQAKRLEGITISLENAPTTGGIEYRTHVQTYGWQPWVKNGAFSGTTGQSKRLEAIQIRLTGEMAEKYDVYYRVQAQTYGWLGWAKNGAYSGTAGLAKRLEAIQIVIVKKGTSVNGNYKVDGVTLDKLASITSSTVKTPGSAYIIKEPDVSYRTHVESFGWQNFVSNGTVSGTVGQAKRLEGIEIKLGGTPYTGGIRYRTHVQTYGWMDWKSNGQMAGTSGQSKRLEAIRIELTGEMAKHYDVYYRVHAQSFGWLGWAKNGEASGTGGYAKRLEGIQIVIVEKGKPAPGKTYKGITSDRNDKCISK